MFRKQNRSKREIRTLIGAGTRVNGDVVFTEGLHVDGVVHGNVSSEDDRPGALSVSENGVIEGDVTVPDLVLEGTVKGNVEARERVELGPTARVIGNVVYNLIEMAIGAVTDVIVVTGERPSRIPLRRPSSTVPASLPALPAVSSQPPARKLILISPGWNPSGATRSGSRSTAREKSPRTKACW